MQLLDAQDPLEEQVRNSPDRSQFRSSTARQSSSARHAACASISVGKLAIPSLGHCRSGICTHSSDGLLAHIPIPQHTACVRPAYVAGLPTRVPLPQPPRSLHGVKWRFGTDRAVVSPTTSESWMYLPVSMRTEGVRAFAAPDMGREKAAKTPRTTAAGTHRDVSGIPASVATSPVTAVLETTLQCAGTRQ